MKTVVASAFVCSVLALTGCSPAPAPTTTSTTAAPEASGPAKEKVYDFHGTVKTVTAASKSASIAGDEVKGWMDAMTMDYSVKSDDDLKNLVAGKAIDAKLHVTEDGYWLTDVKPSAK